jgi:hypothetical protein
MNVMEDFSQLKRVSMSFFLLVFPMCLAVPLFSQSPCETPGPIPFQDHDKWGYVSGAGIVVAPRFDLAGPFTTDGAVACAATECGRVDTNGSFLPPTWGRQSRPFPEEYSEGLAPVLQDGEWGYVDYERKIVIPFKFKFAGQFDQGMARVNLNDKFFFIDEKGIRVTPEFDGAFDFHEGLAAVEIGKNVGYIRRDGTFAIPPVHESASGIDFSEGLAAIRINGRVGFMDRAGKIVIQPKYHDVFAFSDGRAPVELGGKWGYVDKTGNLAIPIRYDIAHMFSEGLASVERNGKWQYIDRNGDVAFPAMFDAAMPFCGGVAAVETFQTIGKTTDMRRASLLRGKHGIIDHSGNYVWRDAEEKTWRSQF